MKAILMSIQPKWCDLIAHGNKTIEVRKTKPKLEPPFKVYIYCTKNSQHFALVQGGGTVELFHTCDYRSAIVVGGEIANGKVIGEFVCDKIYNLQEHVAYGGLYYYNDQDGMPNTELIKKTCLSNFEIDDYGKGKPLYGLHISQLKLYDEPKELSEFKKGCNDMFDPQFGSYCVYCEEKCNIKRPPQSWCYVEEQDDDKTK